MWSSLVFLLVGVAVGYCDHEHAWNTNNEYKYLIQSETVTTVDNSNLEASGVALKGVLVVQAQTPNTLQVKVPKLQYAHVNEQISQQAESNNYQQQNERKYRDLSISGKPFEITVKHGVIRNVKVNKDVPVWEVNVLKSIISQLQVDTQGENRIENPNNQIPDNDQQPFASYKVIEDSVGGNCEVYYDITPMTEYLLQNRPELVPLPHLDESNFIEIKKTKNYQKCKQLPSYNFNAPNSQISWPNSLIRPSTASLWSNDEVISQTATSHTIISGNLKRFTIQSSVTTSNIFVKLISDSTVGNVQSKMNLTLVERNNITKAIEITAPNQLVSTGNLVYAYNNPFSETADVQPRPPSTSPNSQQTQSSESSSQSSSEEARESWRNNQQSNVKSGSSSSSSSSEEVDTQPFLQPTPRLNEAPHIPFLPFFTGINGKSIHTSDKINAVQSAANLLIQIAEGMQDPNAQDPSQTLEKLTILQNLLRTMNTNQLLEVEQLAVNTHSLAINVEKLLKIFDKIISQIGTGPALEAIKKFIEKNVFNGLEAAMIVSRIPKTVRTPTAEYVEEFYKLVSTPQVMKQDFLNICAPLALAELIRNVQNDKRNFPVHSFGRMNLPSNKLDKYVSFFAKQLEEGIQENNSQKIQTYIVALSNTNHPKILSIFEPYLEGKQTVTKYQRLLMVTSLSQLAKSSPRLARSVLYKLFSNVHENDEIRVAAFHSLIKSDPSLSTLLRIAQNTHYERSTQVNSAVTSTIDSLAKLKHWQAQGLANKARIARRTMTNKRYNYGVNSIGYYADSNNKDDLVQRYYIETINGVSNLPQYAHLEAELRDHNVELGYGVSNLEQLLQYYSQNSLNYKQKSQKKTLVEKLALELGIKSNYIEQLEGHFLTANTHETHFYPFDKNSLEKLVSNVREAAQKYQELNLNLLYNHDKIISFPTESGLPFTYTVQTPTLQQVETRNTETESNDRSKTTKGALNVLIATKQQNRFGFTTPFEHQQYLAGIDRNYHVQLPIEFKLEQQNSTPQQQNFTKNQVNLELRMNPKLSQTNPQAHRLIHTSTVPFVTRHDILDLQPLSQNRNMQTTFSNAQQGVSQRSFSFGAGVFNVTVETDKEMVQTLNLNNAVKLLTSSNEQDDHYKKVDLYLNDNAASNGIRLNIVHLQSNTDNPVNQQSKSQKSHAFIVTDGQPNSEARRKQFLTELEKDNQPANNHVWDINIEYPTLEKQKRQILTIGVGHNNVNERNRALLYWNVQSARDGNIDYEALGTGEIKLSPRTPLSYVKIMDREQQNNFQCMLQYGKNYTNGEKIYVHGNSMQSMDLKNIIQNSETAMQCQKEIEQGNKGSQACLKAIQLAEMKDRVMVSISVSEFNPNEIIDTVLDYINRIFKGIVKKIEKRRSTIAVKNTIEIDVKMSPDRDQVDVFVSGPDKNITLSSFGMSDTQSQSSSPWQLLLSLLSQLSPELLSGFSSQLSPELQTLEMLQQLASGFLPQTKQPIQWSRFVSLRKQVDRLSQEEQTTCTVDKTQVTTFDGKIYPLQAEKSWHVVLIPVPQVQSNESKGEFLPSDSKVVILVREKDGKQVRFIFSDNEVQVEKSNDGFEVTINGQHVKQYKKQDNSDHQIVRGRQNGEVYVEISELPDKSLWIDSNKYGISAIYDGESIQIKATNKYRGVLRGLCGNYDSQPDNDFLSPDSKCVARKSEEFTSMYTLMENGQQRYTAKNKNKQYSCVQQMHLQSDVISDVEAGRSPTAKNWGYHDDINMSNVRKGNRKYQTAHLYTFKASNSNQNNTDSAQNYENRHNKTPLVQRTKIFEENNLICFSVTPVPSCDQNSKPTSTTSQKYGLYCSLRNEQTEQLKKRIQQGANPDLSQKPTYMLKVYEVPLGCEAA